MLMILLFFFVEWCSPVSMWHLSLFLQRACRSVCSWQVNSAAFHNFTTQMKTNWRWDELCLLHATNQHHLHHMLNEPIPVWKHDFDMYNNLCLTGEEDGSSWCNKGGWQPATNKGWVQLGLWLYSTPLLQPHLHGPGFMAIQVLVGKFLHWIRQPNAIHKIFWGS